jgi:hypothetical protein
MTILGTGLPEDADVALGFDPETLYTPESFEQEFPPSPDPKINGSGGQTNGTVAPAGDIDESSVAADTLRLIREGVEDEEDRSYVFYNVMMALKADVERIMKNIVRRETAKLREEEDE